MGLMSILLRNIGLILTYKSFSPNCNSVVFSFPSLNGSRSLVPLVHVNSGELALFERDESFLYLIGGFGN